MLLWLVLAASVAFLVGDRLSYTRHRIIERRLLEGPLRGKIGDVVRISGWVDEIPAPLEAPFSGVPCAAFSVSAALHYPRPLAQPPVMPSVEDQLTAFTLRTRGGRILVRGERVDFAFAPKRRRAVPRPRREAYAERWKLSADNVPRLSAMREHAVVLGDHISVMGRLCELRTEGTQGPYRDVAIELCLTETADHELIIGPVAPSDAAFLDAARSRRASDRPASGEGAS